jgi:molecular chaperone DnaK (HSP70)
MTAIGIDFGTTNSVVAVKSSAGVEVLPIDTAPAKWAAYGFDNVLPSVMARDDDSRVCFGWEAKQRPTGRFDAVKRMFATQLDVATDDSGSALAVEEVATMLFAELKRRAAGCGVDASQAVITVPANSKGRARLRTKLCAGMAGLEVLALVNEPTAAAMAYAQRHPESRQLLVFDWGGGTLDVTILQSVDGVFIEQASSGLPRSGGIDFDSRLEKIVRETTTGLENLLVDQRHFLRTEIELAKIRLSTADVTSVELPNGKEFRITRSRFEQEIAGLLDEARIPLERCLSELQIGPGSIDSVVLVGGTCRIPAVRRFVESALKSEIDPDIDPMTAVGEGAAIAASILTGGTPDSDFFVCLEHALGTWVFDPQTGSRNFSTIIRKGNKLPAQAAEPFVPVVVDTESVTVSVVEGDPDSPIPDFTVLKEWAVPLKVPYSEDSNRSFELRYEYDVDGILRVRATDNDSGEVLLEDDVSFGVASNKRELKQIADRAKAAVNDGKMSKAADIKLSDPEAMKLIEQARVKVIPFLDPSEAAPVLAAVERVEANDPSSIDSAKIELRRVMQPYSYLF